MKKKSIEYQYPESENSLLREPNTDYQLNSLVTEGHIAIVSEKELAENCMPLAESKRLLFERIYKDFHK